MNRFLLISPLFLFGALAMASDSYPADETSQPIEPSEPAAEAMSKSIEAYEESIESYELLESDEDELSELTSPATLVAGAGNAQTAGISSIEDIDAPTVEHTALPERSFHGPRKTDDSEVVCVRIIPTGSRIPVDLCRRRSDIERTEENDRRIMDDIKRNTALGAARGAASANNCRSPGCN